MSNPGRVTPDPFDHPQDRPQEEESSLRQYDLEARPLLEDHVIVAQPSPVDVVVSRGWVRNPGNLQFRNSAKQMANSYRAANPSGKVLVAQLLVYTVQHTSGGRFLRRNPSGGGGWRSESPKESLQTALHALRVASMHLPSRRQDKALLKTQGNPAPPQLADVSHPDQDVTRREDHPSHISQTRPQAGSGAVAQDTEMAESSSQYQRLSSSPQRNMALASLQDVTRALQENEISLASSSTSSTLLVEVGNASDVDVRAFCCAIVAASRLHHVRSLHMMLSPQLSFGNAKQLALAIRRCRGLDTMQIEFKGARSKFALLLVAAAIGNPFVTTLFLNGNRLGDRGALWIAGILHRCPRSNVQCISLENNDISTIGAMALQRVLQEESTTTGRRIRVALGDGGAECFVVIPNDDEYNK